MCSERQPHVSVYLPLFSSRYSLDIILHKSHNAFVTWEVEYTDEFEQWWDTLSEEEQKEIGAKVALLEKHGPVLPRPHSDTIANSRFANMKELRGKVEQRHL